MCPPRQRRTLVAEGCRVAVRPGSASASRRPPGRRGRAGYRPREPSHSAMVRRRPERASWLPATSPELRTCPRCRPRPGSNGHGGALRLRPQRLPHPLQAVRTSPACDRGLRCAPSSACRTWRTTFRCRRATLLEFPASASARRSARTGRGARSVHRRHAAPKRARNGPVAAVRPPAASVSSVPRYFLPELIYKIR